MVPPFFGKHHQVLWSRGEDRLARGGITTVSPAASSSKTRLSAISVSASRVQEVVCSHQVVRLAAGQEEADRVASASTRAWILVLSPPRDRLILALFFRHRRYANGRAQCRCRSSRIRWRLQMLEHPLPAPLSAQRLNRGAPEFRHRTAPAAHATASRYDNDRSRPRRTTDCPLRSPRLSLRAGATGP